MKSKQMLRAFGLIDEKYIEEYMEDSMVLRVPPSKKEKSMGQYERTRKHSMRRVVALILAACLVMGLCITAYASGGFNSLIAKWASRFVYETPTDELREERPDYAEWLDEQLEIQGVLQEMGEQAQQVNEEKSPEELAQASITLLESYYDGEKIAMTCRLSKAEMHVTFDFDDTHPKFNELAPNGTDIHGDVYSEVKSWESYVPIEEDRQLIKQKLESKGCVGFTTGNFGLSDHVYVNNEDFGYGHSEVESDGLFYIDPFYSGLGNVELPESCRDQSEVDVTVRLGYSQIHWWLEGDKVLWAFESNGEVYPVTFTIKNINQ